jgi:hypothetical protein
MGMAHTCDRGVHDAWRSRSECEFGGWWRFHGGRTWERSLPHASPSYGAPAWQREVDQLIAARHGNGKGRCSPVATSGAATAVDDGVEEVLGLVLHNDACIRSTPIHKKKDRGGGVGTVAH